MYKPPQREREDDCLAALEALGILDTPPASEFDALVNAASRLCDVPVSLISLIDAERQWFKANVGLPGLTETPRHLAFCAHAVLDEAFFEVPDTWQDARFVGHPLVTGPPHIRFYAAVPLCLNSGLCIGTICVIDYKPKRLNAMQRLLLTQLAAAAVRAFESGRLARQLTEGEARLQKAASSLAAQRALLDTTLQSVADAVITTDAHSRVSWLNSAAERMTGWRACEAQGVPLGQVLRLSQQMPIDQLVSRDGTTVPVSSLTAPVLNEQGEQLGQVLVLHDMSEQHRLAIEMGHQIRHDALTGLVNRAEFEAQLGSLLHEAAENHTQHALVFIDLDEFKLVNDAGGHTAGDQVLIQVAALLKEAVRESDTLARLGGDEFGLILARCTAGQALRVAQKICDRLDGHRFLQGINRFRIGASVGLAPIGRSLTTITTVLQAAESACLAAKESGGNRVHAWSKGDQLTHARHADMQWATRIEQAIDEDRFALYAQRIEALGSGGHGLQAEVLLRMIESDGAVVSPGAFLPAAERFHLASRIDRWVLRHAIDWLRSLPSLDMVHKLSVNLSGQSVGDRSFHLWAQAQLSDAGEALCRRLCLEITETAAVNNMADAAVFVVQVRQSGVQVALDDFGSGAASFGYLKRLPIDYLKIDGQFVRTLLSDPLDEVAVKCFVEVAKVLGIKTVAEFVDQQPILDRLREMGVDFAQGYLLHRPEPIDELTKGWTN